MIVFPLGWTVPVIIVCGLLTALLLVGIPPAEVSQRQNAHASRVSYYYNHPNEARPALRHCNTLAIQTEDCLAARSAARMLATDE